MKDSFHLSFFSNPDKHTVSGGCFYWESVKPSPINEIFLCVIQDQSLNNWKKLCWDCSLCMCNWLLNINMFVYAGELASGWTSLVCLPPAVLSKAWDSDTGNHLTSPESSASYYTTQAHSSGLHKDIQAQEHTQPHHRITISHTI